MKPETETIWLEIAESGIYTIWRSATMPTLYQITTGDRPRHNAGSYNLGTVMKALGLRLTENKER